MVKLTRSLILACLLFSAKAAIAAERIVVLVPGFFNSFAPEYFSTDILATLQAKGLHVVVAEHLNPIGTIEDNGERILKIFNQLHQANPQKEIDVIGHSAGGLYALYAINKGAHFIKNLITISTPYTGVEFVENWESHSAVLRGLMQWSYLDGLRELTQPYVKNFLNSIRVPSTLKVVAFGGYQPVNLDIFNAANMSGILSISAAFITGPSDGVVGFNSATQEISLQTLQKSMLKINVDRHFYIPLEHWEQTLDYRSFILLGTYNLNVVRTRQIQFYGGIADLINKL